MVDYEHRYTDEKYTPIFLNIPFEATEYSLEPIFEELYLHFNLEVLFIFEETT